MKDALFSGCLAFSLTSFFLISRVSCFIPRTLPSYLCASMERGKVTFEAVNLLLTKTGLINFCRICQLRPKPRIMKFLAKHLRLLNDLFPNLFPLCDPLTNRNRMLGFISS